ncbi:baculoviral IAP repeat-containing protein 3-like [Ixodes scapularis]|uniref:baculoviral IAP repeat-containing protein 3-like n=1 Tax=Ixodes scapularis TaxID=6945 RepID=UPI001A9F7E98|nr:baculoviral IAP repeat-containing protein 3-like [Ixodes scapularis]
MQNVKKRFLTYKSYPTEWVPDPRELALAGFKACVFGFPRCMECDCEYKLLRKEGPMEQHRLFSPTCSIIVAASRENDIRDCDYFTVDNYQHYYSNPVHRMESFERYLWPDMPSIQRFVDAGLYAINGVLAGCFVCHCKLYAFHHYDDPLVDHVQHSPKCAYLNATLDKRRIDAIYNDFLKSELYFGMHFLDVVDYSKLTAVTYLLGTNQIKLRHPKDLKVLHNPPPVQHVRVPDYAEYEMQEFVLENDATACKICYSNQASVIALPCGHCVTCNQCALRHPRCCICRKTVSAIIKRTLY